MNAQPTAFRLTPTALSTMEAAQELAKRSREYADEAAAAPAGQWWPMAARSIRAGKASLRLMRRAERMRREAA